MFLSFDEEDGLTESLALPHPQTSLSLSLSVNALPSDVPEKRQQDDSGEGDRQPDRLTEGEEREYPPTPPPSTLHHVVKATAVCCSCLHCGPLVSQSEDPQSRPLPGHAPQQGHTHYTRYGRTVNYN